MKNNKHQHNWEKTLEGFKVPQGKDKEKVWNAILAKIDRSSEDVSAPIPQGKELRFRPWSYAVAAAVVVLLGVFAINQGSQHSISSAAGQYELVSLPNGSSVRLNPNTSLSWNSLQWFFSRKLQLSGEAYFDVTRGSTFTVETDQGKVAVLGTEFRVIDRGERFRVSCTEGKVLVTVDGNEQQIVVGEMTQLAAGKLTKAVAISNEVEVARSSGEYNYENIEIGQVLRDVEHNYGVVIVATTAGEKHYTGFFSSASSLEETLELICKPLGLTYERNGNEISVTTAL